MKTTLRIVVALAIALGLLTPVNAGCPAVSGCRLTKESVRIKVYADGTNEVTFICTYACGG
jgi:hypothetical protein